MRKISLLGAAKHTSPNPVTLICTRTPAGITNLATVSWWTILSLQPERIGFALMKEHYTGEMLRANKKAILTIPGEPLAKYVMQCGSSTGREIDKVAKFGIPMREVADNDIQIPEHTVVFIECGLHEYVDVGDHYFYICDVQNVEGDDKETALFAWNGYSKIAPAIS